MCHLLHLWNSSIFSTRNLPVVKFKLFTYRPSCLCARVAVEYQFLDNKKVLGESYPILLAHSYVIQSDVGPQEYLA